ncbi:hypothetical protein [[Mycoplasma] testudinis]|uniref:hypothetical protein n=1 Tax=[Mycoplasma] testudinis TaxID=33924 RepID=UPI000486BC4D|nr:hypothetical protein [[Mycoplasma] testudinis]
MFQRIKFNWSFGHHHKHHFLHLHSLGHHHHKVASAESKNPYFSGVIMYTLLFIGYFVFVMSWSGTLFVQSSHTTFDPRNIGITITANQAIQPAEPVGTFNNGLIYQIFPNGVSLTISRATNWSLTIGRGIGAIFFGWLITRLNHKYSVLIALGLMVAAFPYLLAPYAIQRDANGTITNSSGVYAMFIVFRILMALGGTTLISYTNGVIATYCKAKAKTFSSLNVFPANLASIIGSIFLTSSTITAAIGLNWQVFGGVLEIIMGILFVSYSLVGKKIDLTAKKIQLEHDMSQKNLRPKSTNPMLEVLRKKEVYFFLIGAMFLSYITVEPGTNILANFWVYSPNNSLTDKNLSWILGGFNIAFLAGVFIGLFTVGRWLRTKYSYNHYTSIMFFFGTLFIAAGVAVGYDGLDSVHVAFVMILTFIGSAMLFGINGIFYAMPYRWGYTPSQITALIALLFGFSYGGYTILDIITSAVMDAGISHVNSNYPNEILPGNGVGAVPAISIMFLMPLIGIIAVALIPKEKDAIKFSVKDFYQRYITKTIQ